MAMKNKRFNVLSFLRAMLTLSLVLALTLSMAGCFEVVEDVSYSAEGDISESENQTESENESDTASESASESGTTSESETTAETEQALTFDTFTYDDVPNYAGFYYTEINGNVPFFTEAEIAEANQEYYEYYSPLDELGRCGFAMASVDTALMPTEERGDIYWVHPSGWQKNSGYERTHLIAFQIAGENANEQNLITGTHYLNGEGMLPFEEMVGDYVRETNTRVLYRVTPIYVGDELVARGVLMEAMSLADGGEDILYNIFVYNVFNPDEHKLIDYMTGEVYEGDLEIDETAAMDVTYIINRNSGIFHIPSCEGVQNMNEKNKIYFTGTREELIEDGYKPCPHCNP